jgi:hypothetical protein
MRTGGPDSSPTVPLVGPAAGGIVSVFERIHIP